MPAPSPADTALRDLRPSPGSAIDYCPHWLSADDADALLRALDRQLDWRRDDIQLFGRRHPIPRRHAWVGAAGVGYGWSGLRHPPAPWPPALAALAAQLRAQTGTAFNGVLANRYADGRDCMGWHSDDEASLGPAPSIAAVSLGAERPLVLRHRTRAHPGFAIALGHGSLLLMRGRCQRDWQHALPRRRRVAQLRISLTFRAITANSD